MSIFETLSKINVNEFTQKKNSLTYLPWAYAWGTLKSLYPDSFYIVAENDKGWNYFTDGRTCWVKCAVTAVNGEESSTAAEYLPVMDHRNNAIPYDQVTSTQVNKAIQRCLTKAIARLGLGLYIYAGEDLPDDLCAAENRQEEKPNEDRKPPQPATLPFVKINEPVVTVTPPVVTVSDKVPEAPAKSRTAIVRETCANLGITEEQFGMLKKLCTWAGTIPAVKVSELSDDEFNALIDYAVRNAELSA